MDNIAKKLVKHYIEKYLYKSEKVSEDRIFIVWKCKTLQNWKYLLSTSLADEMYYELTYNGNKKEWYIDAYEKVDNKCITEEDNEL